MNREARGLIEIAVDHIIYMLIFFMSVYKTNKQSIKQAQLAHWFLVCFKLASFSSARCMSLFDHRKNKKHLEMAPYDCQF